MSGGDIEAAGRGVRNRVKIDDGWCVVIITLDESGMITIEFVPDEPLPQHKMQATMDEIFERVAVSIWGRGVDAA